MAQVELLIMIRTCITGKISTEFLSNDNNRWLLMQFGLVGWFGCYHFITRSFMFRGIFSWFFTPFSFEKGVKNQEKMFDIQKIELNGRVERQTALRVAGSIPARNKYLCGI